MYYYSDFILLILIIVLPLIAQGTIKSRYNKYSKIKSSGNLKGKDVAKMILERNGLGHVGIEQVSGSLTDHYSPKTKCVSLSESIYNDDSISAISVAAHECGHAIQDKEQYSFFQFRQKMVPLVNITSKFSSLIIVLGFILEFSGLLEIGIVLLCCGLLFQLITLPVEFDASRRAKIQLKELGLITDDELSGVKRVLTAAAMTYVAGFLAEALYIARILLLSRRRN